MVYISAAEKERMSEKVIAYELHKQVAQHQDSVFKQELRTLHQDPKACVVVMDFAAGKRVPFRQEMETCEKTNTVNVMVFAFYRYCEELGCVMPSFVDMVGPEVRFDGTQDTDGEGDNTFPFFKAAWEELGDKGFLSGFSKISIWSDGGPHHFKIKRSLNFMGDLGNRLGKVFHWRFFASHHGKGACDGHTAVWSSAMRRQVYSGGQPILDKHDLFKVIAGQKNTSAYMLVVPSVGEETVKGIAKLKMYHDFCWGDGGNPMYCNVLSGKDEGTVEQWMTVAGVVDNIVADGTKEQEEELKAQEQARKWKEERKAKEREEAKKGHGLVEGDTYGADDSDSDSDGDEDSDEDEAQSVGSWDENEEGMDKEGNDEEVKGDGGSGSGNEVMVGKEEEEVVGVEWESVERGKVWLIRYVTGDMGKGKKRVKVSTYQLFTVVAKGKEVGRFRWARLGHYACTKTNAGGDMLAACHDTNGCITKHGRECDVCQSSQLEVCVREMDESEWRELSKHEMGGFLHNGLKAMVPKNLDDTLQAHADMYSEYDDYARQSFREVFPLASRRKMGKRFRL